MNEEKLKVQSSKPKRNSKFQVKAPTSCGAVWGLAFGFGTSFEL
jgi:hypothetical protein